MTSHLSIEQRARVREYLVDALSCVDAYDAAEADPATAEHAGALDIVLLENCHYALMVAAAVAPQTRES